jgi:hypothetical protein
MANTDLMKVGLNIEGSWGVGGSPAIVLPVSDWKVSGPYEQVLDNAARGVSAKDFQAYQGVGRAEGSLEGYVFPDLFGYILRAMFGALSSGTVAPYVHTFTMADPPSMAITEDNVVRQHQAQGMLAGELKLSFNPSEGALGYTLSLTGKKLGTVSYVFPTELHLNKPFFLGWQGSVSLGGTWFKVIEGDLTVAREVELHYNLQNSQYPGTAYASAPEVTGSFTIDYTAGSDYDMYRLHQQGSIDLYWVIDSNHSLKIELGSVDFGESPVELDRSGASITLAYGWRGLYQTALGGAARAILTCETPTF